MANHSDPSSLLVWNTCQLTLAPDIRSHFGLPRIRCQCLRIHRVLIARAPWHRRSSCLLRRRKMHGPCLSGEFASSLELGWMDPSFFNHLDPLRRDVFSGVAFCAWKIPRGEARDLRWCCLIGRKLGSRFGNHPVLAPPGHILGVDFDEATPFDGEEVSRRQDLDVDDRLDAVENIMSMDFPSDDLFADFVNFLVHGLMHHGCFIMGQ